MEINKNNAPIGMLKEEKKYLVEKDFLILYFHIFTNLLIFFHSLLKLIVLKSKEKKLVFYYFNFKG